VELGVSTHKEIKEQTSDPEINEILQSRVLASREALGKLDECFRIIREKPLQSSGQFQEAFVKNFRRCLPEIQSSTAQNLFILTTLHHFAHFRIGEYSALIAEADLGGYHGVDLILETCLADELAFAERTRALTRRVVKMKLAERVASASS
jgi:ferritin-like metal-binding protein YciE